MTVFEKWGRIPQKRPVAFVGVTLALVVALTWAIYYRTADYGYLDWDDNTLVEQNVFVTDPSTERVLNTFVPGRTPGPHLPLRALSYIVDLQVFADGAEKAKQPNYHHVTNVWLYALNGVLLFLLLRMLLDPWAAAIATLIWVAHPIHVEAVSWVSGRKEMLSGAFILGGFLAYISGTRRLERPPSNRGAMLSAGLVAASIALFFVWKNFFKSTTWVFGLSSLALLLAAAAAYSIYSSSGKRTTGAGLHGLAILCTLAAFLSKPVAIIIPVILLAWEVGYRPHALLPSREGKDSTGPARGWLPSFDEWRGSAVRLLPHVALILWGFWVTMGRGAVTQVIKDQEVWNAAPTNRLPQALYALWLDVYHLVAPLDLSALYDVPSDTWRWQSYAGALLLVGIPVLAGWLLYKTPKALLWLAWFVAPIAPVSGVILLASIHNDRYLYLPAIALAVALGVLLSTAAFGSDEETGRWERWMAGGLTVAIIGGFSVLSFQRTHVWSADHLLWGDAVKNNPELPSARNNYGAALMNAGNAQGALEQYYKAYELLPSLDVAQFNIAATEFRLGRPEKAMRYAEEFVAQHPEMPTGWILAGQIYAAQHRAMLKSGYEPEAAEERRLMAEESYRKGCNVPVSETSMLQRADKANACNQLAITLAAASNTTGTEIAFTTGLKVAPPGHDRQLRLNRVRFYRQQKRYEEALDELDSLSESSRGNDLDSAREYAHVYVDLGEFERAKEYAQMLLRNPRGVPRGDRQLNAIIQSKLKGLAAEK